MNEELKQKITEMEQSIAAMQLDLAASKKKLSLIPHFSDAITDIVVTGMGYSRLGNRVVLSGEEAEAEEIVRASAALSGAGPSSSGLITFSTIDHETNDTVIDADKSAGSITPKVTAIYNVGVYALSRIDVPQTAPYVTEAIARLRINNVQTDYAAGITQDSIETIGTSGELLSRGGFSFAMKLTADKPLTLHASIAAGSSSLAHLYFSVSYICPE